MVVEEDGEWVVKVEKAVGVVPVVFRSGLRLYPVHVVQGH